MQVTPRAINNRAEVLDSEENVCRLKGSASLAFSPTSCKNALFRVLCDGIPTMYVRLVTFSRL